MLIVAQAINIHLPYIVHPCYKDIKYLETFNIAQTPCTSALAPCHVNRLIVFVKNLFSCKVSLQSLQIIRRIFASLSKNRYLCTL